MSFKNFSVSHTPSDPAKSPDAGDAGGASKPTSAQAPDDRASKGAAAAQPPPKRP